MAVRLECSGCSFHVWALCLLSRKEQQCLPLIGTLLIKETLVALGLCPTFLSQPSWLPTSCAWLLRTPSLPRWLLIACFRFGEHKIGIERPSNLVHAHSQRQYDYSSVRYDYPTRHTSVMDDFSLPCTAHHDLATTYVG